MQKGGSLLGHKTSSGVHIGPGVGKVQFASSSPSRQSFLPSHICLQNIFMFFNAVRYVYRLKTLIEHSKNAREIFWWLWTHLRGSPKY